MTIAIIIDGIHVGDAPNMERAQCMVRWAGYRATACVPCDGELRVTLDRRLMTRDRAGRRMLDSLGERARKRP